MDIINVIMFLDDRFAFLLVFTADYFSYFLAKIRGSPVSSDIIGPSGFPFSQRIHSSQERDQFSKIHGVIRRFVTQFKSEECLKLCY